MIHHPDRGGDTETMQEINKQYQQALESVNGQTSTGTDGAEHQYYYHADIESALMELINQLIQLHMEEVEVALIGTWIWIIGSTKPYKAQLKELDCRWHFKRKCWYFHTGKYRSSHSSAELSELGRSTARKFSHLSLNLHSYTNIHSAMVHRGINRSYFIMSNTHLFPATQKPDFDADHFNNLSVKRNHLDYQCYMFLYKVLNDLPERYYAEADELLTNRDRACDKALQYLITGVKQL